VMRRNCVSTLSSPGSHQTRRAIRLLRCAAAGGCGLLAAGAGGYAPAGSVRSPSAAAEDFGPSARGARREAWPPSTADCYLQLYSTADLWRLPPPAKQPGVSPGCLLPVCLRVPSKRSYAVCAAEKGYKPCMTPKFSQPVHRPRWR